jgi:hypothetical protein
LKEKKEVTNYIMLVRNFAILFKNYTTFHHQKPFVFYFTSLPMRKKLEKDFVIQLIKSLSPKVGAIQCKPLTLSVPLSPYGNHL